MTLAQRRDPFVLPGACSGPAAHVAETARIAWSMGALATSISTQQRVTPFEASGIRRLLPVLAKRYDLHIESEVSHDVLTVTFERCVA